MSADLPLETKCCVETCENVFTSTSTIKFYRFPTDITARQAWCDAIKINENTLTDQHIICDVHFPDNTIVYLTVPILMDTDAETNPTIKTKNVIESSSVVHLEIQANPIKEITYLCDMCDKRFDSRHERNLHIDNHFKTYNCETCGESFIGDRQFEHHRLTNKCITKKPINSITYECYMCHKSGFFTIRSLRIHNNKLHMPTDSKKIKHICEHCQKHFANKYILKSHISQIHERNCLYVCEDCGQSFNRQANLKWHQLIHENKLPCKCKICGKAFRTLSGLNLHKRTHTGEKPYKCHLCEKSYAYNTDLKRHKRTHGIIDKEYHCSICSKVFYEPKFIRKHMQKFHELNQ